MLQTQKVQVFSKLYNQMFSFDALKKTSDDGQIYYVILHNALKDYMLSLTRDVAQEGDGAPIIISFNAIETSLSHSIVDCTVSMGNYQVTETGEATIATLNSAVSKNFPYLEAQCRAYDRAVISFLQLQLDGKRIYSDHEVA